MKRWGVSILLGGVAVLIVVIGGTFWLQQSTATMRGPGAFVGRESCAACHQDQLELWTDSHHDLAMQEPTAKTILGDFQDASFTDAAGITSRFLQRGDQYFVRTQGADGAEHEYPVRYTFGVHPLQQYLLEIGNGRLQAFTVAWDAVAGKWYSLHEDRKVSPDDWLHWSQRGQNWNSNCAECHSTNVQRNYDFASDSYDTKFSEIDVSCEACHGPASRHVAWAEASGLQRWWAGYAAADRGLQVRMRDPQRTWGFDERGQPKLLRTGLASPDVEIDQCARCHSRRGPASREYEHGQPLLDHFVPQLLQENIYHADGQILDEVFEHGSFVQSKMYHHGVRCSDCHEPHSLTLRKPGNQLCVSCHAPAMYDSPTHHHHEYGTPGASCVECHMPTKTYMGIDARRDHSLRIPRPDLTKKIGVPNACNQCHTDKDAQWAMQATQEWYGTERQEQVHYGQVLKTAWEGDPRIEPRLQQLMLDGDQPAIVRASAISAAMGYPTPRILGAAVTLLKDPSPMVRRESIHLLAALPPQLRGEYLRPLLNDPIRSVRHSAALGLMDAPRETMTEQEIRQADDILQEYAHMLRSHADNVGGRLRLATLEESRGRDAEAEAAYAMAVRMDGRNLDGRMAYAEFLIRHQKDAAAEEQLRRTVELPRPTEVPESLWRRAQGMAQYQLGLLIASDPARLEEGIGWLFKAADLLPDLARVRYNLGEALRQAGRLAEARSMLESANSLTGGDADVLAALVRVCIEEKRVSDARRYLSQLATLDGNHPALRPLMQQLQILETTGNQNPQ